MLQNYPPRTMGQDAEQPSNLGGPAPEASWSQGSSGHNVPTVLGAQPLPLSQVSELHTLLASPL